MADYFSMVRDRNNNAVQALRLGTTTWLSAGADLSAGTKKIVGASGACLVRVAYESSAGRGRITFGTAAVSACLTAAHGYIIPGVEVFKILGTEGDEDYISVAAAAGHAFISVSVVEG